MFALADYDEPDLLQCSYGCQMIHARQLRHPLDGDFLTRDPRAETRRYLRLCRQILVDCNPNILQRLFARCPLAIATGQIITPNGEPLLGFNQRHLIFHNSKVERSENFFKLFLRRKGAAIAEH